MIGKLEKSRVIVWEDWEELAESGYGKLRGGKLILSFCEALYLHQEVKLSIQKNGKEIGKEEFWAHAQLADEEFPPKYRVYKDLRGRGFLVKTGFKFGTHFRVYKRGIKLKHGMKAPEEHTKWVVHAVPEAYRCSFPELSRFVRLAQNIRTTALLAVVDEEGDVTYYSIRRRKL